MDGVNALIARGVAPPQYNVLGEMAKAQQVMAQRNALQYGNEDAQADRQLRAKEIQLRELALDVQRKALETKDDGMPVSIDYPTFSVKGTRQAVANAAATIAQYADQFDLNDPEAMAWLASQGVSVERPKETAGKKSSVAQMLDDAGITDPAERQRYIKQALEKATTREPGQSFEITQPDGTTIRYDRNNRPVSPMTTGTQGKVEESLLKAQDSHKRLMAIWDTYDKSFLQLGTRKDAFLESFRQKAADIPALRALVGSPETDPEEKEKLKKYWTFRQNSVANLNKEIKDLTGAAMNKEEVPRLAAEVPNAGLGFLDGDSPDQFEAKLQNKIKQVTLYQIRYAMLLRQGLGPQEVKTAGAKNQLPPIDEVEKLIEQRGNELANQGMTPSQIKQALVNEFLYGQ